jgi:hypothetical protein
LANLRNSLCARKPSLMDENTESGRRMDCLVRQSLIVHPDDYPEPQIAVATI